MCGARYPGSAGAAGPVQTTRRLGKTGVEKKGKKERKKHRRNHFKITTALPTYLVTNVLPDQVAKPIGAPRVPTLSPSTCMRVSKVQISYVGVMEEPEKKPCCHKTLNFTIGGVRANPLLYAVTFRVLSTATSPIATKDACISPSGGAYLPLSNGSNYYNLTSTLIQKLKFPTKIKKDRLLSCRFGARKKNRRRNVQRQADVRMEKPSAANISAGLRYVL